MFTKYIMISAVLAMMLTGCGSSEEPDAAASTDITVERGPVLGALVLDDDGNRAVAIGNGMYRFAKTFSYPVTVNGGYIDINRNAQIDAGEVRLDFDLEIAEGTAATVVSTVANNSEIKAMLQNRFSLNEDDIRNATPGTNREIAAVSDELYAYCIENSLEPLKLQINDMEKIADRIAERIRLYKDDNRSIAELEEELIADLGVDTLTDLDLPEANRDINNSRQQDSTLIDSLPIAELSEAEKEGLIFMIEEEKLARDVYEYLFSKWGLNIFSNIAKSEQKHMDAVKVLLDKYSLSYPTTLETADSFENEELQSLYDTLIARGDSSIIEALEVGKLIEEVDIEDLKELITEDTPKDLKTVYENLLNGSYNHLSAFTSQLSKY